MATLGNATNNSAYNAINHVRPSGQFGDASGTPNNQRFAVCVRNMFDEERAGNPGYLDVTVRP